VTQTAGDPTVSRKGDHIDIILGQDVRARVNGWDDVHLVHEALPEVDLDEIDTRTTLLNHDLEAPIMVASMTGGYPGAKAINERLAAAAAAHGFAMGVGSQRAMLKDPSQAPTYEVVREHDVPFIAANIGAPQLIAQGDTKPLETRDILRLIDAIDADALIVHLNYLQEVVQPEGDTRAAGVWHAIEHLVKEAPVPVIAKETGAGLSATTAARLVESGVAAIDVGGLSGTTFAAVERVRAERAGAAAHARLGELFRDWGIATPVALREALTAECEVIATGGLRHGLDVARAVALGAHCTGLASATLAAASQSAQAVEALMDQLVAELRTGMFLSGASTVDELRDRPVVVTGAVREHLLALGHDPTALGHGRRRPGSA